MYYTIIAFGFNQVNDGPKRDPINFCIFSKTLILFLEKMDTLDTMLNSYILNMLTKYKLKKGKTVMHDAQ